MNEAINFKTCIIHFRQLAQYIPTLNRKTYEKKIVLKLISSLGQ